MTPRIECIYPKDLHVNVHRNLSSKLKQSKKLCYFLSLQYFSTIIIIKKKKQESSWKTSTSALLIMPKPLTVWITANCGKFFKRWEYHITCLLRNLYEGQEAIVRTRHERMDWFQIGKGVHEAVYCHPAYLTYMQSTSYEMLSWMKHKLESRCQRKYQ